MRTRIVLFVDDDERVLRAWRRSFVGEPYSLLFARCADEAQVLLSGMRTAVVVSDYMMPGADGIELLEWTQRQSPETVRILVSGNATLDVAQEAVNRCGIWRLFQKPCSPVTLAISIRAALQATETSHAGTNRSAEGLMTLEARYPGISEVKRDRTGRIIL